MHGNEVVRWRSAIGIENQPTGPYFEAIQRIDDLITSSNGLLDKEDFDGTECSVIPETSFKYSRPGGKNEPVTGRAFFARPTHLKDKAGAFEEREEPYIFAYIDPDIKNPTQYALRLDVLRGTITTLGDDQIELESEERIKSLLFNALSAAKKEVLYLQDVKYRDAKLRKAKREKRMRTTLIRAGAATVIAAVLSGAIYGGANWYNGYKDKKAKRAEAAREFDNSNYQIEGGKFKLSSGAMASVALEQFFRIPEYHDGDSLIDARRIELNESDCKTLPTKIPSNIEINVAVKQGEQFKDVPIGFSRNKNNELVVCSFSKFGDHEDDKSHSVGVALQIHTNSQTTG
jgi:hypothetical protein